jgi:hypothetical protein
MKRVDSLTSEPTDSDLNKVLLPSSSTTKIYKRRVSSRSSEQLSEATGYKIITVGGNLNDHHAVANISPSLKSLADKNTGAVSTNTAIVSVNDDNLIAQPTHRNQSTATDPMIETSSPPKKVISPVASKIRQQTSPASVQGVKKEHSSSSSSPDQASSNRPVAYTSQLVGNKDGVHWERVQVESKDDCEDDPLRDKQFDRAFSSIPASPSTTTYDNHPLMQMATAYGGGQVISVTPAVDKEAEESEARPNATFHDRRFSIAIDHPLDRIPDGDYVDPSLKHSRIAGQAFLAPDHHHESVINQELSRKEIYELTEVNAASEAQETSAAAGSYWLSRVHPLRAAGKVIDSEPSSPSPLPMEIPISKPNDEMQQSLLHVIQAMMKSQQDSAAGVQAMMLTLIDTYHQERLISAEAANQAAEERKAPEPAAPSIVFPPQPSAIEIAEALAVTVKEIIASIPLNQPPQPTPIIIQAPAPAPVIAPSTLVVKDEGIQAMMESQDSISPPVRLTSASEIQEAVHEGIVHGIRDILDIICPAENDLDLENNDQHLAAAKDSIRKNIQTIDTMERFIKSSSGANLEKKPMEHGFLHIDRNRRVESVIEAEIIDSQKRQNLLKLNRKFEAKQMAVETTVFREDARAVVSKVAAKLLEDDSSTTSSKKYRDRYQNLQVMKSVSSSSSPSPSISGDSIEKQKTRRASIKQPPPPSSSHVLISKVLSQEATAAMMEKDDASLYGSEIFALSARRDQSDHPDDPLHREDGESMVLSVIDSSMSASDRVSSAASVWESMDTSASFASSTIFDYDGGTGVSYDQAIENEMRLLKMHRLTSDKTSAIGMQSSSSNERKPVRLWRPR